MHKRLFGDNIVIKSIFPLNCQVSKIHLTLQLKARQGEAYAANEFLKEIKMKPNKRKIKISLPKCIVTK